MDLYFLMDLYGIHMNNVGTSGYCMYVSWVTSYLYVTSYLFQEA